MILVFSTASAGSRDVNFKKLNAGEMWIKSFLISV